MTVHSRPRPTVARLAVLALGIAGLTACAQPRYITYITGEGDQAKMIYSRRGLTKYETGLVQCSTQPDGTLYDCKKIPVRFSDGKGPDAEKKK